MHDRDQGAGARYQRVPPLAAPAVQGRFGAASGAPGVMISLRHPASIVTIIARKDKAAAASEAIFAGFGVTVPEAGRSSTGDDVAFHWCGAEQWYAVGEGYAEGALYRDLRARLAGSASCSDQSHGRVIISISGPKARAVLAKGTPVDLHPRAFGQGRSAVTQMAHVGVHLAQTG